MSPSSLAPSNLRAIIILIVLDFHAMLACFFLIAVGLHFASGYSRRLDSLSANAYGLYLVHYNFVVWLQYALLGTPLFAMVKAAIVFGGTLVLSWIAVLAVQRIPFGAQLIGAPRRAVAMS